MARSAFWGGGLAAAGAALALALAWPGPAPAAKKPDVRQSKHNLSATYPVTPDPRDVKSAETQVCVFCHTPHGGRTDVMPLWNRQDSGATYTTYTSSTYDAQAITAEFLATPAGSSKLCLSCHDGTIALGQVSVLNGASNVTVNMSITGGGQTMPGGSGTNPDGSPKGAQSGFTRLLGTDLRNDHPISVTFSNTLVARDGELRNVTPIQSAAGTNIGQRDTDTSGTVIGVRSLGYKPDAPMEATGPVASGTNFGQVQCSSCHDPHMIETDLVNAGNNKFLRQKLNRFQGPPGGANQGPVATGDYLATRDIICIACHKKEGWPLSAHADPTVGNYTYNAAAATLREFPTGTTFRMWNAACLNCHDTHSVQGAVRLAREGTDGGANGVSPKQGGNRASEQTCYQCHQAAAGSAIASAPGRLDVMTDMTTGLSRKPIALLPEVHDIGGNRNESGQGGVDCTSAVNKCGKDLVESRLLLGFDTATQQSLPNETNRHVECTDCHNAHRVLRNSKYDGSGLATQTTHDHAAGTVMHTNTASGALSGTFGVEPTYTSTLFGDPPTSFTALCGTPGSPATAACSAGPVTKEYQICLKCHSNYAYGDIANGSVNTATYNYIGRPRVGWSTGLTQLPVNPSIDGVGRPDTHQWSVTGANRYTNQATEFQGPCSEGGELNALGSAAACSQPATINHRSWHPVLQPTFRSLAERGNMAAANWLAPWNNGTAAGNASYVGSQTMLCSDCHGNNVAGIGTSAPDANRPWGPHGSANTFILKAPFSGNTGTGATGELCFKCHSTNYATSGATAQSGFCCDKSTNLHEYHVNKIRSPMKCTWCHVAVPHGWKDKALLANTANVGPEVGLAPGTSVAFTNNKGYTKGPYYLNAFLRVINWKASGNWTVADCNGGSVSGMRTNCEQPQ